MSDSTPTVRAFAFFVLCTAGCNCAQSHTRDSAIDAAIDAAPDRAADAWREGELCDAPVLYDEMLCLAAPFVRLCIEPDREMEAMSMVPALECDAGRLGCEGDAVPCTYGASDMICDGMSVMAYNNVICRLWTAGLATDVAPIPLD